MSFVAVPDTIREDERLAGLSDRALAFFLMLLAQVDAHGRIGASPKLLNATVWPLRERSATETAKALEECRVAGVLGVFEADGLAWIQVDGWDQNYQPVGANRAKRPRSRYPDPIAMGSRPDRDLNDAGSRPDREAIAQVGGGVDEVQVQVQVEGEPERETKPRGGPAAELWNRRWLEHRGEPYSWTTSGTADGVALARCLKAAGGDLGELDRRIVRMLTSTDQWLAQNASPRILHSRWNQLAVEFRPLSKADKNSLPTPRGKAVAEFFRNA